MGGDAHTHTHTHTHACMHTHTTPHPCMLGADTLHIDKCMAAHIHTQANSSPGFRQCVLTKWTYHQC